MKNSKIVYSTDPDYKAEDEKSRASGEGEKDFKKSVIRMALDRKNRAGKSVTILSGFTESRDALEELARTIKSRCATGGTVKNNTIEIQGDHRDRIEKLLTDLRYKTKRV